MSNKHHRTALDNSLNPLSLRTYPLSTSGVDLLKLVVTLQPRITKIKFNLRYKFFVIHLAKCQSKLILKPNQHLLIQLTSFISTLKIPSKYKCQQHQTNQSSFTHQLYNIPFNMMTENTQLNQQQSTYQPEITNNIDNSKPANLYQQQIDTTRNLDWPDSFIDLLNSLSEKQQQQQQLPVDVDHDHDLLVSLTPNTSSLLIDNRDFELIALDFDHNEFDSDDENSVWLMNFANQHNNINDENDNAHIISLAPTPIEPSPENNLVPINFNHQTALIPTSLIIENDQTATINIDLMANVVSNVNNDTPNEFKISSIDENNNNNDQNLINLMKLFTKNKLCDVETVTATTSDDYETSSNSTVQSELNDPFINHSKCTYLSRRKTLPTHFNRITSINLNENEPRKLITEIKQDFEEDEEQDLNGLGESTQVGGQLESQDTLEDQRQLSSATVAPSQNGSLRSRKSDRTAQDADGRHSMLQFALYNFRDAINKYSLESQAHKAGQVSAGDTSTLRGSLKLIETLRGTRSGAKIGSTLEKTGTYSSQQKQKVQQRDKQQQQVSPDEWTWRELAELVKFTPNLIKQPLLRHPNEELERKALESFRAIMQYMGDAPDSKQSTQSQEVECVYLILMNCHNFPHLRDEIYCQLMKQTTNNRSANPDSCLRGWRLFSIVAAYFDCSAQFKPYLLKYLETAAYDKRRAYCSVASLCLQNLRKTLKYGGRKNVPSIEEIAATSAGRNSKRQIYRLPGGTERVINTKSTTVVEDIIHEICSNMLGVSDLDEMLEFSLYCIADGDLYTMPLNRDEYILDITTELIKNHQQYFLIFCRSIWHYPLRLDSKLYIEVIFNQIAPDYLEGLLLVLPGLSNASGRSGKVASSPLNPSQQHSHPLRMRTKMVKEIARIAALLHRASGTDYMPHKDEIKYLLPKPIVTALKYLQRSMTMQNSAAGSSSGSSSGSSLNQSAHQHHSITNTMTSSAGSSTREEDHHQHQSDTILISTPRKWVELVQNNWREMSAFDTLDAKAQFLDIVRHWPLFGSSFFAIKFIQRDLIQPMNFILALNKLGIQMLDMNTHETIHKYPFNDVISTRKVRSEDGALFLDLKCGNLMKRTIVRIQTDQAHEISRLIKQYIDIELLQQKQQQQLHQPPHNKLQTLVAPDINNSSKQLALDNELLATTHNE